MPVPIGRHEGDAFRDHSFEIVDFEIGRLGGGDRLKVLHRVGGDLPRGFAVGQEADDERDPHPLPSHRLNEVPSGPRHLDDLRRGLLGHGL
jgi:hypothetical protein